MPYDFVLLIFLIIWIYYYLKAVLDDTLGAAVKYSHPSQVNLYLNISS